MVLLFIIKVKGLSDWVDMIDIAGTLTTFKLDTDASANVLSYTTYGRLTQSCDQLDVYSQALVMVKFDHQAR